MTIRTLVQTYNIPDELISSVNQTPSKYVLTSGFTMAKKNSGHVPKQGADDKRAITLTLAKTLSEDMLPFHMIYTGKTSCSLPTAEFSEGFLLGFNKSHWSNEEETMRLLKEVTSPYITKMKKKKKKLKLPQNQVVCLFWDAFKTQSIEKVKLELEHLNIKDVKVPKNMKHLLQPLDLTINGVVKKMEQSEFSNYFTNCITKALLADPKRDAITIKVDLKLSTLKPIHAKTISKLYEHLKSDKGKQGISNGFRVPGIMEAVKKMRENPNLDLVLIESIIELISLY